MASPLDIPRRPKWRFETINNLGRRVIPASVNDLDRAIIEARKTPLYREDTDNNLDSDRLPND